MVVILRLHLRLERGPPGGTAGDVQVPRRAGATVGGDEFMACGGDDAGSSVRRLAPNSGASSSAGSDAGMVASEESSGNSGTGSGLGSATGGMSHVFGVKASARGCGASLRLS